METDSEYLNKLPRSEKEAIQDCSAKAIAELRAQVIWRYNFLEANKTETAKIEASAKARNIGAY